MKKEREKGVIMKNKTMKKVVALSVSTMLMAATLAGCGEAANNGGNAGTTSGGGDTTQTTSDGGSQTVASGSK